MHGFNIYFNVVKIHIVFGKIFNLFKVVIFSLEMYKLLS